MKQNTINKVEVEDNKVKILATMNKQTKKNLQVENKDTMCKHIIKNKQRNKH